MKRLCRNTGFLLAAGFFLLAPAVQASSDYPNRAIQYIACYAPGGSDDLRARALAPTLEKVLGQPVVVVNKVGASGSLAMTVLAKAKPDGYTLGNAGAPLIFNPYTLKVDYNSLTDFTYIAGTATQAWGIVVKADAPWKTMDELLEYIKKNPGKLRYGSWGIGGGSHIYMEAIGRARGLKWIHIPFKGDQPLITALLGGHIPVGLTSASFFPYVKSGQLRALAVLDHSRIAAFPQVPTLKELGFDFVLANGILGTCAPKGVPPAIVKKLESALRQAAESDDFRHTAERLHAEPRYRGSQEFTREVKEAYLQIGEMIKELGIQKEK